MVKVSVAVGIGGWKARKDVELVAAPHVGDQILVGGVVVTCERVTIGPDVVYVEETVRFSSEDAAARYFEE